MKSPGEHGLKVKTSYLKKNSLFSFAFVYEDAKYVQIETAWLV